MKVVILCGGAGTRLREQTEFMPKPMVPVGGKPLLWHIMKIYYHQGYNEFILPLGYKGEIIKDYFVNYHWKSSDFTLEVENNNRISLHDEKKCENWKIHFVDTGENTLTANRVYKVKKLLKKDERFMLTYGDGVADIDLKKLLNHHLKKGKLATITGHKAKQRFGLMQETKGLVQKFKEKPQMKDYLNAGYMIFEQKALKYFTGKDEMLEQTVLPKLSKEKQLTLYSHPGIWHYMDTQRDLNTINKIWETNPKWKIWTD